MQSYEETDTGFFQLVQWCMTLVQFFGNLGVL